MLDNFSLLTPPPSSQDKILNYFIKIFNIYKIISCHNGNISFRLIINGNLQSFANLKYLHLKSKSIKIQNN